MDVSALSPAIAPAREERVAAARPWIQSWRFDLAFFILSPLIALPMLALSPQPSLISLAFACVIGVPHYLSTFVFFFWDDTRTYHRTQWLAFFGGPVLIVLSMGLAIFFSVPYIVQLVVYVWNTQHVSRQSCGILSIYRQRAGAKDPALKPIANGAIIWTAFAMAFWNTESYPLLHKFLTLIWPRLPLAIWIVTTSGAVVALARLGWSLVRRFRSEAPPDAPELAFLTTSLLLFHPYLWLRDANQATLAMLLGHFVQYLAIVWLVHWRKFGTAGAATSAGWLARLSSNRALLIATMILVGTGSLAFRVLPPVPIRSLYASGLLTLTLLHFYLDGLFWAFRRPEVRRSLGPYLAKPR